MTMHDVARSGRVSTGGPASVLTRVATFLAAGLFLAINVVLAVMTPSFIAMFTEMGEPLPALTVMVISVPPVGWALVGLGGAALVLLKDLLLPLRGAGVANVFFVLGTLLYAGLAVWCLVMPLVGAIKAIE